MNEDSTLGDGRWPERRALGSGDNTVEQSQWGWTGHPISSDIYIREMNLPGLTLFFISVKTAKPIY